MGLPADVPLWEHPQLQGCATRLQNLGAKSNTAQDQLHCWMALGTVPAETSGPSAGKGGPSLQMPERSPGLISTFNAWKGGAREYQAGRTRFPH